MWHFFLLILQTYDHDLPRKYPRAKVLDLGNTHEEDLWTHKIRMRKNFGPTTDPREKILDPPNTHEKKILKPRNAHFWTHEIPTKKNFNLPNTRNKKIRTYETPTRKNFGPTKYTREKILGLRIHNGTMTRDPRCSTRSTEFSTLASWKPLRYWGNTLTVLLLGTVP